MSGLSEERKEQDRLFAIEDAIREYMLYIEDAPRERLYIFLSTLQFSGYDVKEIKE